MGSTDGAAMVNPLSNPAPGPPAQSAAAAGASSSSAPTTPTTPSGKFIEQINYGEIEEGEIIGKGSYGLVIRARWKGRDVAIKVFQTEAERSAFKVELRTLSRVEHKNIIRLYGATTQLPHVILVMEYAECGSLYRELRTQVASVL